MFSHIQISEGFSQGHYMQLQKENYVYWVGINNSRKQNLLWLISAHKMEQTHSEVVSAPSLKYSS